MKWVRLVLGGLAWAAAVVVLSARGRARVLDALFGPADDATAIPPTGPPPIPPSA